ncbi:MAG TPA: hypothetical protein VLB44_08355 [Kofleriaceae bacterium]|nr:hypothetical protein [Kofleriaceae bacterium]
MAGCTAQGQVQYAGEADVQLVELSPGVQVIADYDEPVFYSESYYWRYDNGVWYRSPYHSRGWVRVQTVPVAIRQIDQPRRYVHYHAQAGMEVRDHRTPTAPPPPPPGPVVRDHRDEAAERHEQHEAAKEERKEQKEAAKEERKEQKEAAKDERKEQKEERKEQKEERKEERKEQKHEHRK